MGLRELLGEDFKPSANTEGFDIIEGLYGVRISGLRPKQNKQTQEFDRYEVEMTIEEVKSGDQALGRKLWKSYWKDNSESVKDMLCDLFTMGLDLSMAKDFNELETMFGMCIGAKGTVRAQKWTPTKDMKTGAEIPEEARVTKQTIKIIKKKTGAKTDGQKLPF